MTLTFTMDELRGLSIEQLKKLYVYYFSKEAPRKVSKTKQEEMILQIYGAANITYAEKPLPDGVPQSVRVRRIYQSQVNK